MAPHPELHAARPRADADRVVRWADLAAHVAEPNSFYAPEWLVPALERLDPEGHVRVLEVEQDGTLIGLMPVMTARRHGRLPVAHVTNWTHPYCFLGSPLIRAGQGEAAWRGFLDQLDAAPWAPGFLHLTGVDAAGANAAALEAVCALDQRVLVTIDRYDRALLRSDETADAYWEANVRAKKRKELRRLEKRLEELGAIDHRLLTNADDVCAWADDFLALEASGWKGAGRTALANDPAHEGFFRTALAAAFAADRLRFLRIDLDGRAIAMLVNFLHGDGSFSFKIAIDEELGRYSPGVLIERDNLFMVQGDPVIAWMDSCAAPDHPMIDSLWSERRSIAQYRVALGGSGPRRLTRNLAMTGAGWVEGVARILREVKAR